MTLASRPAGTDRNLGYVSPRRNRPRRDDAAHLESDRVRQGVASVQQWRDGEWQVRGIGGGASTKTYRCPGCDQEIRPGVAHLVAWPADGTGDLTDRRHWHSGCWRARDRRGPAIQRGRSAPKYG
ncbi:hypothetical protein M2302_000144 [Micromonospora sp. A200]|nr:hypothetical protein [Micromonospora sp. A200]